MKNFKKTLALGLFFVFVFSFYPFAGFAMGLDDLMKPVEPPDTFFLRSVAHKYFGKNSLEHHRNREDVPKNMPGIPRSIEIKDAPQCEQCLQAIWYAYQFPHQSHRHYTSLSLGEKCLLPVACVKTFQYSYPQYCKHPITIDLTEDEES